MLLLQKEMVLISLDYSLKEPDMISIQDNLKILCQSKCSVLFLLFGVELFLLQITKLENSDGVMHQIFIFAQFIKHVSD